MTVPSMPAIRRFAGRKSAVAALLVLLLVVAAAGCAGWLFDESPWAMVADPLVPPFSDRAHPLGTDMLGRDVLAGLAYGARISIMVAAVSTAVTLLLGVAVGAVAGYWGGLVDDILMGVTEFFQIIPPLAMALVLVAIFTPTLPSTVGAISVVSWPALARLVRGEFLSLKNREFVLAARVLGERPLRIAFAQILPNATAPIVVSISLLMASAVLAESALAFLGLGVPDTMSWGVMIGAGRTVIREAWWVSVWPGILILVTVLAIHLVGEGLKAALQPRRAVDGGDA